MFCEYRRIGKEDGIPTMKRQEAARGAVDICSNSVKWVDVTCNNGGDD